MFNIIDKIKYSQKLKAGTLLYSIFISFLITSILTTFILLIYFNKLHVLGYDGRVNAINNVNSGINYLLAYNEEEDQEKWVNDVLLFEDEVLSLVNLESKPWGLFRLIKSKSTYKRDTFRRAALVGYSLKETNNTVLYLADRNQPLSLAGNTRISGDAYLSKRGLKRAYIEGRSYSGSKMIEGKVLLSNNKLPQLRIGIENSIAELLEQGIPSIVDTLYSFDSEEEISINRSFNKSVLGVYSNASIELLDGNISGPVVVKAKNELLISRGFKVENALLIASKIVIEDGFVGTLQAIASDTIIVGKKCELQYPSALYVSSENEEAYLELGEDSKLKGDMVLTGDEYKVKNGVLTIKQDAEVIGNVYSIKKMDLKGKVYGTVALERFYLRTRSSIYENHLLDGVMDRTKLPEEFIGSGLVSDWSEKSKSIMTWLD